MITSGEPVAPGQSPIPVVIIQQGHEGMTAGELWVTGSTIALAGVTALTALIMIYEDHKLINVLIAAIKAIVPPYRSTLRAGREPSGTDVTNAPAARVNKIMSARPQADRSA